MYALAVSSAALVILPPFILMGGASSGSPTLMLHLNRLQRCLSHLLRRCRRRLEIVNKKVFEETSAMIPFSATLFRARMDKQKKKKKRNESRQGPRRRRVLTPSKKL
jgi:hypothetical protein